MKSDLCLVEGYYIINFKKYSRLETACLPGLKLEYRAQHFFTSSLWLPFLKNSDLLGKTLDPYTLMIWIQVGLNIPVLIIFPYWNSSIHLRVL